MGESYKMPPARLGPCLWYPSRDSDEAVLAVITEPHSQHVNLSVIAPDNRGFMPRDGVRHRSDPEVRDNPEYDGGCWDYTQDQKDLHAVLIAMADLSA